MYILKNAITSITRNKGRNILIGVIILAISCATAVTLAIYNSSNNLIESYEDKYEVEATLGVNRENMMGGFDKEDRDSSREKMEEAFSSASSITTSDIESYADSSYVKDYFYTITVGVNSNSLEQASVTSNNNENQDENARGDMPEGNRGGKEGFSNATSGDFTLTGYSSVSAMSEFLSGKYKITEGEVSSDFESDNCIINSTLATLNDINVGDTIEVVDALDESLTYTLTVTGIFEEESDENAMAMFDNSVNTIITNTTVVNKITSANSLLTTNISPTFTLTNKDVIDSFQSELEEKGLSEYLTVQTNLDEVESATSTISNVKTFAVTFLIITLIIGTIVLLVINMINIRERKYEIGVLRTIGMKKKSVAFQFMSELIMVSFVALLLGAGLGSFISVPVSNHLLENEISESSNQQEEVSKNFGGRGMMEEGNNKIRGVVQVNEIKSIDAVVDLKVLVELLGIGVLLTLISSASALINIERFSPLDILKERS